MFSNFDVSIKFKTITVDDKSVQTYSIGDGDSVILSFPPFPHSGLIYSLFLLKYPKEDVRIISFDLPGWIGMSEDSSLNNYSEEALMKVVDEVIKIYKLKKFSVLGFSYGGVIATKTAVKYPSRVKKISLVSPIVNGPLAHDTDDYKKISLIKKLSMQKLSKLYIKYRFKKYSRSLINDGIPKPFIEWYRSLIKSIDEYYLVDSLLTIFENDFTHLFEKIKDIPILVVNSRDETRYFRVQARYLRRLLDGEDSYYIHGSHEDFILHPKKKNIEMIINFLI
jgi:pimeloyl-ACP methyl ester carboxylesterase